MNTYIATPYDRDAAAFGFTTKEEFDAMSSALRNRYGQPVDEFEIHCSDVSIEVSDLAQACNLDQGNLGDFLAMIEEVSVDQYPNMFYLMNEIGCDIYAARIKVDDVILYEGDLQEAADELFDKCYLLDTPKHIQPYVDYEKFARDCQLDGTLDEFKFAGKTYVCTNASDF